MDAGHGLARKFFRPRMRKDSPLNKSSASCPSGTVGALFLASGLLLAGCGGGGGTSAAPPSPAHIPVDPVGVWKGTLASTNPAEAKAAVAIVSSAEEVRIITEAGFQYAAGPGLANGTVHAPAGRAFLDGSTWAVMFEKGSQFNHASPTGCPGHASYTFWCKAGGDGVEFVSTTRGPAWTSPTPRPGSCRKIQCPGRGPTFRPRPPHQAL